MVALFIACVFAYCLCLARNLCTNRRRKMKKKTKLDFNQNKLLTYCSDFTRRLTTEHKQMCKTRHFDVHWRAICTSICITLFTIELNVDNKLNYFNVDLVQGNKDFRNRLALRLVTAYALRTAFDIYSQLVSDKVIAACSEPVYYIII